MRPTAASNSIATRKATVRPRTGYKFSVEMASPPMPGVLKVKPHLQNDDITTPHSNQCTPTECSNNPTYVQTPLAPNATPKANVATFPRERTQKRKTKNAAKGNRKQEGLSGKCIHRCVWQCYEIQKKNTANDGVGGAGQFGPSYLYSPRGKTLARLQTRDRLLPSGFLFLPWTNEWVGKRSHFGVDGARGKEAMHASFSCLILHATQSGAIQRSGIQ